MNRGNRDFNQSSYTRGNSNNFRGNSNFRRYDSFRGQGNRGQIRNTQPNVSGIGQMQQQYNNSAQRSGNNVIPALGNLSQFSSGQAQLELAGQILNAVLSNTNVAQLADSRSRDRSSRLRSRSPDYRSSRSSRRSRSRSPRPGRSFDRFDRPRGGGGRPFSRGRPRFERAIPAHKRYERVVDKTKPAYANERYISEDKDNKPQLKEATDDGLNKSKTPETSATQNSQDKHSTEEPKVQDPEKCFPSEALYCHICNHGGFTSEETYLFHLEGIRHRKTARAFHDKNETTLEYLRKNAKLASIRVGRLDSTVAPYTCTTCYAFVRENFFSHKKLLEHKLVKKFLMPRCCGRIFKSHHDMDEHRLSLPHLKQVKLTNEQKTFFMEQLDEDQNKNPDEIFSALKSKMNKEYEEVKNLDFIPPFDGNTMIGIEHLKPKLSMLCEPCQTLVPSTVKSMEMHLISLTHYNNMVEFLRNKKKQERETALTQTIEKSEKPEDVEQQETSEDEAELMFDESAHLILEEVGEKLEEIMADSYSDPEESTQEEQDIEDQEESTQEDNQSQSDHQEDEFHM